jgi:hypothetical protein
MVKGRYVIEVLGEDLIKINGHLEVLSPRFKDSFYERLLDDNKKCQIRHKYCGE